MEYNENVVTFSDLYSSCREGCGKTGVRALSERRVHEIVGELEMLDLVRAMNVSRGRHGRV